MKTHYLILMAMVLMVLGCHKQDAFLDVKGSKSDVVPRTLKDFQALLDYDLSMNTGYPGIALIASDNIYISDAAFASGTVTERNAHSWQADVYAGASSNDWRLPYKMISNSNIVLEGLDQVKVTDQNRTEWNAIRGSALFFRAIAVFNLLQVYAAPYPAPAGTPGVPLRLSADIHLPITRAPLEDCYKQVNADLEAALPLLPLTVAARTRPSRAAAYGLLARVALTMSDYPRAGRFADSFLLHQNTLVDFNTLNASASFPFPGYQGTNPEIVFYATGSAFLFLLNGFTDTLLYRSYAAQDLRKTVFYRASGTNNVFKGSYVGGVTPFAGIAVNEILLIRAECHARAGKTTEAMQDLNTLLQKRFRSTGWTPLTAANSADALDKVLAERRKELPFTVNIRWTDLRRLNMDPVFAKTLIRRISGQTYTLLPGSPRYVFPIPDPEIRISGIEQNPR